MSKRDFRDTENLVTRSQKLLTRVNTFIIWLLVNVLNDPENITCLLGKDKCWRHFHTGEAVIKYVWTPENISAKSCT